MRRSLSDKSARRSSLPCRSQTERPPHTNPTLPLESRRGSAMKSEDSRSYFFASCRRCDQADRGRQIIRTWKRRVVGLGAGSQVGRRSFMPEIRCLESRWRPIRRRGRSGQSSSDWFVCLCPPVLVEHGNLDMRDSALGSIDVFVSYAHEDRRAAEAFESQLRGKGWSIWWDSSARTASASPR